MKKKITIIIVFIIFLSCEEKKEKINEPNIFLSFKSSMNDEEFERAIQTENINKNLINDKFIIDLIDEKLYFEISRNSETIQLKDELKHLPNYDKYITELLQLFQSKYENVENLHLPINSGYSSKDTLTYIYNWLDITEYFRGKKTYNLRDYGFEQMYYYKAFNESSDIVTLIGYTINDSILDGLSQLKGAKVGEDNEIIIKKNVDEFNAKKLKDITITLNYFSKKTFESWVETIEKRHKEFFEFKKRELEKDKRKENIKDSISTSNLDKI